MRVRGPALFARLLRHGGCQDRFKPVSPILVLKKRKKIEKKGTWAHSQPRRTIKKSKKRTCLHTPHLLKKSDKLLCPFRVAVALPCVSGVVYLCRDMFFFVDFSSATACYHCVHIASFLHDFNRFSYSLSTTSC
jgi:hypothetical protein